MLFNSLEKSNEAFENYAESLKMTFKSKLSDPVQSHKAIQWKNTVDSLILVSNDATEIISQIIIKYFGNNPLQKYSNTKNVVLKFKSEGSDDIL
jgi:hypothetical protein